MEERRTMSVSRIERMKRMVARFPDDPRARFFLAHELFKEEAWADAAEHYAAYLALTPGDVGAAFRDLGVCHERLGRLADAATAYRKGIEAALAHGHDALASEIRVLLDDLGSS
jgi:tetratricopeptide (TPR) repeat protein